MSTVPSYEDLIRRMIDANCDTPVVAMDGYVLVTRALHEDGNVRAHTFVPERLTDDEVDELLAHYDSTS